MWWGSLFLHSQHRTVTSCTWSKTSTKTCQQSRHQKQPIRDVGEFCTWSLFGFKWATWNSSDKMEVSVHRGACCSYQSCKEGHSQMPEVIVQQSAVYHVPENSNASWLTQCVSCRDTETHRWASLKQTGKQQQATACTRSVRHFTLRERGKKKKKLNSVTGREITGNAALIFINIDFRSSLTLHVMTNTDRYLVWNQWSCTSDLTTQCK